MFQILSFTKDDIVALRAEGKLTKEDYKKVEPLLKKKAEDFGVLNFYLELKDLKGITAQALWEDFKTYFTYFNKFDRVAVVGEGFWTRSLARSTSQFVKGTVKYFEPDDSLKAKRWIEGTAN